MSGWLIAITGTIYAFVALEQFYKGNLAMTVVYSGYAFSNIGLYLLAVKQHSTTLEFAMFKIISKTEYNYMKNLIQDQRNTLSEQARRLTDMAKTNFDLELQNIILKNLSKEQEKDLPKSS